MNGREVPPDPPPDPTPDRGRRRQPVPAGTAAARLSGRPAFLPRTAYRRRRLHDAARLLPIAGALLLILPMLWSDPETGLRRQSRDLIYLFGLWSVVIAAAAVLSRRLVPPDPPPAPDPETDPDTRSDPQTGGDRNGV